MRNFCLAAGGDGGTLRDGELTILHLRAGPNGLSRLLSRLFLGTGKVCTGENAICRQLLREFTDKAADLVGVLRRQLGGRFCDTRSGERRSGLGVLLQYGIQVADRGRSKTAIGKHIREEIPRS